MLLFFVSFENGSVNALLHFYLNFYLLVVSLYMISVKQQVLHEILVLFHPFFFHFKVSILLVSIVKKTFQAYINVMRIFARNIYHI